MKFSPILLCVLLLCSCSKEIKDGPYVYFSNETSIPDTISANDNISFEITAIGNGYKVTRAQLFVNKTEFFDTTFKATDSVTVLWSMNFAGRTRTQNVMIQASDEHELISTRTKKIFVK